jgi:hypothetical protein
LVIVSAVSELGLDRLRNAHDGTLEGTRNVAGKEMEFLEE